MKTARAWLRPWSAALVLCLSAPIQAEVWIVELGGGFGTPAPGADFGQISSAVNAAADGDTILVRDGTYTPFTISGKSLRVVADGADVRVDGFSTQGPGSYCFRVQNLPAGKDVLVRGLRMNYGVSVSSCAGAVWIDDVLCTGGAGICAGGGARGVDVSSSSRVTFTRCAFVGEVGHEFAFSAPIASEGARVLSSIVQFFDCRLTGGAGASRGQWPVPQPGAAGMRIDASTVTIIGCAILGGGGGVDPANLCSGALASGGPGVMFAGGPGTVRSAESMAVGGATSLEPLCPGQTGPQGPAISGSGTIVALPGFARHLRANGPVRGGESLTFELEGVAGEIPMLLVSLVHEPLPLLNGSLLVGLPPTDVLVLGALPASGEASLSFPVPNVGTSAQSLTSYVQAAFLDSSPRVWLGAGTPVVLLDASF